MLVVPTTGTYGVESLGRILAGDINPSGRTVDTYVADASKSPAAQNFGDYQYLDESGNLTKYNYVSYEEGIYVGYRYYETRYEDAVLGQGNAGDFTYADEAYSDETCGQMTARFWHPVMRYGVIAFPRPEDCPLHKPLRAMEIKPFGEALGNFSGLKEFGEVE